jgi:hypothetical protein
MSSRLTRFLIIAALVAAGMIIWSKVRIVFWVHLTWWQLLLLFLGIALVIFWILDTVVDTITKRR